MTKKLSMQAFSALRWNYFGSLARSLSNLFIGALLARLLGPKPFGELAAAGLVIGIANLLADAGFTLALVQAPSLTTVQIRYVFTIQFLIAFVLTIATVAIAGPVAVSFHDPVVRSVLIAISPTFLLQAIGQTSNALLRRELAFRTLQVAQMISYVCCLAVAVPLAIKGAGVWSLVVAQLLQVLVYSVLLYAHVRHSVVPTLAKEGADLLKYGSKVTIVNVTNWGITNLDNALVGHSFGSASLGLYSRAFNLGYQPAESVVGTLQQVLFAASARADGRIEAIRRAYFASVSAIALIVLPAFWSMAACSETVVVGLYGPAWRASAVFFTPLAIALSIHSVMALAGPILNAVGLVRQEMVAQAWTLALAIVVFLVTSRISLTAFAWGVCGVYIFRFIVMTQPALHLLQVGWKDILRILRGPTLAALSTTLGLFLVDRLLIALKVTPFLAALVLLVAGCLLLGAQIFLFGHHLLSSQVIAFLRDANKLPAFANVYLGKIAAKQSWNLVPIPGAESETLS